MESTITTFITVDHFIMLGWYKSIKMQEIEVFLDEGQMNKDFVFSESVLHMTRHFLLCSEWNSFVLWYHSITLFWPVLWNRSWMFSWVAAGRSFFVIKSICRPSRQRRRIPSPRFRGANPPSPTWTASSENWRCSWWHSRSPWINRHAKNHTQKCDPLQSHYPSFSGLVLDAAIPIPFFFDIV